MPYFKLRMLDQISYDLRSYDQKFAIYDTFIYCLLFIIYAILMGSLEPTNDELTASLTL